MSDYFKRFQKDKTLGLAISLVISLYLYSQYTQIKFVIFSSSSSCLEPGYGAVQKGDDKQDQKDIHNVLLLCN